MGIRTRVVMAVVVAAAVPVTALTASTAYATRADATPKAAVDGTDIASSAPLPTAQMNGVAWAQVIVGTKVYVAGSFTQARPAKAQPGTNESPRSNLLAYDLTTGALSQTWAPSLNDQATAIAASADGRTIYVGGDFTSANGANRYRIAAFDAVTGALKPGFAAKADARVRALIVSNGTLYAGGSFSTANGQPRTRLAAFDAATGALKPWAPSADRNVEALIATPRDGGTQIVIGGRFGSVNGQTNFGTAALDPAAGTLLSWPVNTQVTNGGQSGLGIKSLFFDGTKIYGTGFNFVAYRNGWLEGTFAADTSGNLAWVAGCHGDTHAVYVTGSVVYTVGHSHGCDPIGYSFSGYRRGISFTADTHTVNNGGDFGGLPGPTAESWFPYIPAGTYTGQDQGAWIISGNGDYVVLGGEFPSVAGVAQQGLVRFAIHPQPPTDGVVAMDTFSRDATSGWGIADLGGAWSGPSGSTSASGGAGTATVANGASTTMTLPGVSLPAAGGTGSDVTATVAVSELPTGGNSYFSVVPRKNSSGDYRARVGITPSGSVDLRLARYNGATSWLTTTTPIVGVTIAPGARLTVRVQAVTAGGTTTLRAKVWPAGTTEPAAWQATGTDSYADLQNPGTTGVIMAQAAGAAAAQTFTVDDIRVTGL